MKANLSNTWLKAGAAVGTFFATSPVFAQVAGSNLGQIATTTGESVHTLGSFMNAGCWGGGTLVFVKGLWGCYEHGKNSQTKLGPQVASLAGGAALLTAPSLIGTIIAAMGVSANTPSGVAGLATGNSF